MEDGLGEQLLELTVSETVVMKFLISLTFGDQKYVPFRVLSRMQIYGFFCELGVRASTGQPHQKTRKNNDLGITRVLAYVYI